MPEKKGNIKCPHCDRYDFLSVYRTRTMVEFRNIDCSGGVLTGTKPYTGNWKKEKDVPEELVTYKADSEKRVMNGKCN